MPTFTWFDDKRILELDGDSRILLKVFKLHIKPLGTDREPKSNPDPSMNSSLILPNAPPEPMGSSPCSLLIAPT
jgi:hypothetical protein